MSYSRSKLVPAICGGALITVISGVPGLNFINCMCCSGIVGGGVLAVYLHGKSAGTHSVNSAVGVELGLLSGLFATLFSALVIILAAPYVPEILNRLDAFIDQRDIEEIINAMGPGTITYGAILIAVGISLVINVIFATIGGLVGASFLSSDKRRIKNTPGDEDSIVVEEIDLK